jgi:hypothetical protein
MIIFSRISILRQEDNKHFVIKASTLLAKREAGKKISVKIDDIEIEVIF